MKFHCVDEGCLMYEAPFARWIIEHPKKGYLPTHSKKWDVIIEHPEEPHTMPLKYMGSFQKKSSALCFVKDCLNESINYFNAQPKSTNTYNSDYSVK